tara:strand:- start:116 stop:400 length:285 start_codon:yes stop_codon:yes gene_type:complete
MAEYRITDIYSVSGVRRGKKFKSFQFSYKVMDENTGTWPKIFKKVTNSNKKKLKEEREQLETILKVRQRLLKMHTLRTLLKRHWMPERCQLTGL